MIARRRRALGASLTEYISTRLIGTESAWAMTSLSCVATFGVKSFVLSPSNTNSISSQSVPELVSSAAVVDGVVAEAVDTVDVILEVAWLFVVEEDIALVGWGVEGAREEEEEIMVLKAPRDVEDVCSCAVVVKDVPAGVVLGSSNLRVVVSEEMLEGPIVSVAARELDVCSAVVMTGGPAVVAMVFESETGAKVALVEELAAKLVVGSKRVDVVGARVVDEDDVLPEEGLVVEEGGELVPMVVVAEDAV
eukprot:3167969-Rhodomonas_salina.2